MVYLQSLAGFSSAANIILYCGAKLEVMKLDLAPQPIDYGSNFPVSRNRLFMTKRWGMGLMGSQMRARRNILDAPPPFLTLLP